MVAGGNKLFAERLVVAVGELAESTTEWELLARWHRMAYDQERLATMQRQREGLRNRVTHREGLCILCIRNARRWYGGIGGGGSACSGVVHGEGAGICGPAIG